METTSRELGQWLGLSASRMQSMVLPGLRHSGVVTTTTLTGEFGEHRSLECEVLPLRAARSAPGHSLALSPAELATWFRLVETLMAPRQSSRGCGSTSAGLLDGRTGRGASTDRLALLLVLEAAETGRVRLCGGTVDTRRGRPAATLARLLDCGLPGAERALERLENANLVRRMRRATTSGLRHRTRLVVPAVTAVHRQRAL
ncbi:hypothetical protein ACFYXF_51200 [Streptomyces sp. NPDC002680]|uniref:hypothetical protein n=1 Tax=Streptomyces sp. NPDC002680 TaxID=3364659 RepID=UPI0036797E31